MFTIIIDKRNSNLKVALKTREIKEKLARRNISQNNFARILKISRGYMSQLFSGTRNPSAGLRKKIMKELKLDEDHFDEIFKIEG